MTYDEYREAALRREMAVVWSEQNQKGGSMAQSYEAFAVCGADYSDPAIIAINSFCKFNPALRLRVYVEAGTNISRLRAAVGHYRTEFRETEFPELPEHEGMGDSLSGLFYRPAALSSFAQRIRGLEELRQEGAEIIVNLDLDTLTCGNITPALRHASPDVVLGVSERANRSRWQKNLGIPDDAAAMPGLRDIRRGRSGARPPLQISEVPPGDPGGKMPGAGLP